MKKGSIAIVIVALFATVFIGCSNKPKKTSFTDKEYIVREAIDGNTIILDNRLKVKLLGISNTPSSYSFLRQEVVGKKVRLKADNKHHDYYLNATKDSVWAHVRLVIDNSKGFDLNGYMLRMGQGKFASKPNNDSLAIYKEYSRMQPNVKMTDEQLCLKMTPATFLIEIGGNGIGTGFFISDDGLALTNNHVMSSTNNPDSYTVYLSDDKGIISQTNKRRVSRIIYTDAQNDFTIFRVQLDPNETVPCLFVSRNEPTRGEHVGVVGNPRGLTSTFTTGELTAIREPTTIQFSAPVYQGNSGGPVCDEYGICIGIVKSVAAEADGRNATGNMNFGVDIRYVRQVLEQIDDIKYYYGK